jgi:ABC-2 type transport system permease protein
MNTMTMLVRREFWEHRWLWLTPLVVAAVLIVAGAFAGVHVGRGITIDFTSDPNSEEVRKSLDPEDLKELQELVGPQPEPVRAARSVVVWTIVAVITFLVMAIELFFYLADSLFAERKDRSILFWKSLPVSDRRTVLSKFLVALVLVPLLTYAVVVLVQLAYSFIIDFRARGTPFAQAAPLWDGALFLRYQWWTVLFGVVSMLWYAPLAAYVMLVSSWARKAPVMWVLLPPFLAAMVEEFIFDSNVIWDFISERLSGVYELFAMVGADGQMVDEERFSRGFVGSESIDVSAALASPALWVGVVAAVLMLYAATWVRARRDDT